MFGLTETGSVNEFGWSLINYIYAAVEKGCLPSAVASSKAVSLGAEIKPDMHICVGELKEIMKKNGINVGNGPLFGLKTRRALAMWQLDQGLEPTGLPDGETRKTLAKNYKNKR